MGNGKVWGVWNSGLLGSNRRGHEAVQLKSLGWEVVKVEGLKHQPIMWWPEGVERYVKYVSHAEEFP